MTYRVTWTPDIQAFIERLSPPTRAAWNVCIREIAEDPFPRTTDEFTITAERTISGEHVLVYRARRFWGAILYVARQYIPDERWPGQTEGEALIFYVRSTKRSI